MSRRTSNIQLNLPPLPLRSSESAEPGFRNLEEPEAAFRKSEDDGYRLAACLFDTALSELRCGLTNKEVAHLVGVSVSLVEKWRSPDARACPSFAQMLRLPLSFHLALHRAQNAHFGFGRAALMDLLESAGSLALLENR